MRALQHASLAPSSHRVYRVGCRQYNNFCHRHNLLPYPLTQKVLMLYVTDLADSLSFKSIKLYLSAIKHRNIALGFKNSIHKMAQLHMLLRGIKRTLGNKGVKKKHQPITLPLLRQLHHYFRHSSFPSRDKVMLWSACTLAFFGFLLSSEYVAPSTKTYDKAVTLSRKDIVMRKNTIQVTIKASKTDPFQVGMTIFIAATGYPVCPLQALEKYLYYCKCHKGPLFQFSNGNYLARQALASIVKKGLASYGISPSAYSTHSFCIGAASTAAAAGIPDSLIKSLGCWRSDCYQRYLRIDHKRLRKVPSQLAAVTKVSHTWVPY